MTVSELWKLCAGSEAGSCSRTEAFRRPCGCLSFCTDSRSLIRWRSRDRFGAAISNPCSRDDSARPCLPRHMRSARGSHGEARSERQEPRVETRGFAMGSYTYKVREGDTLTSIANKFKVPLRSIAILNEIADIDYLPAGKLLFIPHDHMKTGEVFPDAMHHASLVETPACENKSIVQVKGPFSLVPACSLVPLLHDQHVKLAVSFLLLLAVFGLVRKYVSGLGPKRPDEHLQFQIEKEVEGTHHNAKVRRWQGILDDDRRVNEADGDLSDGRAALDTEEENLRQTYAQLESAYAKFLVDSGLSKTGYWRGGVPPALEEK